MPLPTGFTLSASESCAAAVAALPRNCGALGRYLLLERVGAGGMGVVWKAYDPVLDRKIALKLLISPSSTRGSFVTEAQAMARVQHPNVVTVYDAGVQQAGEFELAYVAMELIVGRTLKQWLDEPARSLDERLDLFILAGRGMEAAHAAGLVHRDFKPSNVLLGDDGRVLVSDFGLALVRVEADAPTDDAGIATSSSTLLSPFAGTPRYMSHEQLHGLPADARADQFSFCVALYEAIFGAHPFVASDDASVAELRASVSRLPAPPVRSRLAARLAPVILRGLAADPMRRWPSMRELLAALDKTRGRRGKRLLLAGAVSVLLAVAVVLGWREAASPQRACLHAADALATTWRPERRQTLAAAFVPLARGHGAEVWQLVERTLDDWAARWRALRIEECVADRNDVRPSPSPTARRQCLDRRLAELEGLVQALDKPDETVATYATRAANSLTPPESCLSVVPPVDARAARPPIREGVGQVRARIDRATALRQLGKQRPGADEAKLAAEEAAKIDWAPLTAEAQLELARTSLDMNATDPATDALYRALWSAEVARDDALRLEASMGLFTASLDASNYSLADRWHETAKAIGQHLPADPTRAARLAWDDMRLALHRAQYKQCVNSGQEALRLAQKVAPVTPLVVNVMITLARCHGAIQEEDAAVALLTRALPMSEKMNGHESPQTASIVSSIGSHERRAHHYDAALKDYREALAIRERQVGPDNPDCAGVHNNIGNVMREMKRYDEAKSQYERAIAIWTKAWSADSPAVSVGLGGLGRVAMDQGHAAEAEGYYRRALEIRRKKRPPGHPEIADALGRLGTALLAQKKPEGLGVLEEALASVERNADATAGDRADARFWVARARVELGIRRDGALALAAAACKELQEPAWRDSLADCRAWLAAHPDSNRLRSRTSP